MCDTRAASVLATAFVAGVICTVVVTAARFDEPIQEPFFGIEDGPEHRPGDAEAVAPHAMPDAADGLASASAPHDPPQPPAVTARPAVGSFADMAAALSRPPERLALGAGLGPIAARVESQALPTAGRGEGGRVSHAAPRQPVLESGLVAEPELQAVETPDPAAPPVEELKALVERVRPTPSAAPAAEPRPTESPPARPAPLPGAEWNDPDQVNWSDAAADQGQATGSAAAAFPAGRRRGLFGERRSESADAPPEVSAPARGGRLLDRLRGDRRPPATAATEAAGTTPPVPACGRWPAPAKLREQIEQVAQAARGGPPEEAAIDGWTAACRARLEDVLGTAGPGDARADASLVALGETVSVGMAAGDASTDAVRASLTRRAALAVARRVAVWRAAAALAADLAASTPPGAGSDVDRRLASAQLAAEIAALLAALERFESGTTPADAAAVQTTLRALAAPDSVAARGLVRTVGDHYLAPNVRIAVHHKFVERMLPEATVKTAPMQDFVLGRKVRGTSTVEQSTSIVFLPAADGIRCELLVRGEVDSRTVTAAGPAAIHSRGAAQFTVRKPVSLSPQGLAFGTALGSASNQTQLATIQTSFDGVPIMGSIVQKIVRNQHDESKPQATREVNEKIIVRACREVDLQAEPKFTELAERIRERIWNPMVQLGLEPTTVAMESTADTATIRLRLAAAEQLGAHTPRPRAPAEALLGLQVHESTLNNGCQQLDLAGRRFALEDLIRLVSRRIGLEPRIPADLPEGVSVSFAATQPLRLECRDGLVRIRLALDAIESGRRNWYDVVAEVAYQPVVAGPQVLLERSGQVHLPGHKGLELPLRTIFAKIFPKERPVRLLPASIVENPRLADLRAVQVVSTDGWFALALDGAAERPAAGPAITAPQGRSRLPAAQGRVPRRR
jgi:hypothetical protein